MGSPGEVAPLTALPSGRGYMPRAKASAWRTPEPVIELLHLLWDGKPGLDPCASVHQEHHFARANFHPERGTAALRDGLAASWGEHGTVFVNPPFDALNEWAAKCAFEALRSPGLEIILLLPARTDTRYWHEQLRTADAICFWKGRLTFVGAAACAPFPVAFAYWGPKPWLFHQAFSPRGMVVSP